ncbi:MAG: hypothetical protein GY944_20345 [bacterium]|nr:hypothetical protein [bacterium]
MSSLTELQSDVLGEMINLAIGQAATHLSEITSEEVILTVPKVDLLPQAEAAKRLEQVASNRLTAVKHPFRGGFSGDALLLFPEEKSLALARMMLERDMPLEDMTELDEDALLEAANLILNACIVSIGETLDIELQTDMPTCLQGSPHELLQSEQSSEQTSRVLYISIDFTLKGSEITGFVSFLLELGSLESLKGHLDAYLDRLGVG